MTDTGSEHWHLLNLQGLVIEFHRAGNNGCAPIEMIVSVLSYRALGSRPAFGCNGCLAVRECLQFLVGEYSFE